MQGVYCFLFMFDDVVLIIDLILYLWKHLFSGIEEDIIIRRVKGIIDGDFTVPQIEEEFWRAKMTARALSALAAQRSQPYDAMRKMYAYLFHQKAWHEHTKAFKSFTAANVMPVSFASYIESIFIHSK